jgi:hypothetical protein
LTSLDSVSPWRTEDVGELKPDAVGQVAFAHTFFAVPTKKVSIWDSRDHQ